MRIVYGYVLMSLMLMNTAIAAPLSSDYYRNFWYPTYHVEALDYCGLNHKHCGWPVAHRYCRTMGYQSAVQMIKEPHVGLTHYMKSNVVCRGLRCDGFQLIRCAKNMKHKPLAKYYYRRRAFVVPRYEHQRVSWCYRMHKGCGRVAADSFCQRMGYLKAQSFSQDPHIDVTQNLGDHERCVGPTCLAFKKIICYR